MAKNIHTATGPNGEKFTRTSKTRLYTHAAVARPSHARAMADATSAGHAKNDRANFAHFSQYIDGTSQFMKRQTWERDDAAYEARVALDISRAQSALKGCTTVDDYLAAKQAERIAFVEARNAQGDFDRFIVLGWSSRADLAAKVVGAEGGRYAEARVIDVTVVTA